MLCNHRKKNAQKKTMYLKGMWCVYRPVSIVFFFSIQLNSPLNNNFLQSSEFSYHKCTHTNIKQTCHTKNPTPFCFHLAFFIMFGIHKQVRITTRLSYTTGRIYISLALKAEYWTKTMKAYIIIYLLVYLHRLGWYLQLHFIGTHHLTFAIRKLIWNPFRLRKVFRILKLH